MKKLTLLATTALMLSISPAMANENQSWIDTMTTSVQNWWSGNDETTEVEAYLDEVTIAVPPMTGEEAAQIQPAAGDYVEEAQEEIQNAPDTMMNDEQSFNTDFTNESVTAFEDNMISADDMANIMPAAGDAEEITDESVVVAEEMANEATESVSDTMDAIHENAEAMMDEMTHPAVETQIEETVVEIENAVNEEVEDAYEAQDTAHDVVEPAAGVDMDTMHETMADEASNMVEETMEEVAPMATDAMDAVEETTKDAVDATVETTNDAMDDAHDMMDDHTSHDH